MLEISILLVMDLSILQIKVFFKKIKLDNLSNNKQMISGIGNVRHVRNLESQLSHLANLSDSSIFRSSQHKAERDR